MAIAAGILYTVGLKADGTVVATKYTGKDYAGQCEVAGWTNIVAIAAGKYHTVGLKADGTVEKTVVGSVVESCMLDEENETEIARLREIFRAPSLQMVSFTITEKGYKTAAYMKKVTGLLLERNKAGALPVAMVSMDNCSHNGDK